MATAFRKSSFSNEFGIANQEPSSTKIQQLCTSLAAERTWFCSSRRLHKALSSFWRLSKHAFNTERYWRLNFTKLKLTITTVHDEWKYGTLWRILHGRGVVIWKCLHNDIEQVIRTVWQEEGIYFWTRSAGKGKKYHRWFFKWYSSRICHKSPRGFFRDSSVTLNLELKQKWSQTLWWS